MRDHVSEAALHCVGHDELTIQTTMVCFVEGLKAVKGKYHANEYVDMHPGASAY